jgi:hypothetical protein
LNGTLGEHGRLPTSYPVGSAAGTAGFRRARRLPLAKGHIAKLLIFLGANLQSRAISVKNRKGPGTPVKNRIFNSVAKMLKLRKCVENRRKIGKMQTQFFGFIVKNPTTFVKLVYAFS